MNRLLKAIAAFSLVEAIGRHPAIAGSLMLLGAGGGIAAGLLATPTLVPQVSSNFGGLSNRVGLTVNALSPNGGTAGATWFPTTPTHSFGAYVELGMGSTYGSSSNDPFGGMTLSGPGAPNVTFSNGWWLGYGWQANIGLGSVNAGSSYANGFYPFTFSGSGCAQDPTAVWYGGNNQIQQVSPGLLCPQSASAKSFTAAFIAANVSGSGAQQSTGAGSQQTTCAVVSVGGVNQAQVTAHVAVAHGVTPGLRYALSGITPSGAPPSGYNATYTALPGTSGATLVGTNGATACPASPATAEGSALGGTGASFTLQTQNSNPFSGQTGITTHNNQKMCMLVGEAGDDSSFPGGQYMMMVDDKGNSLPGSPVQIPYPNQGIASFTGYTVTTGQPALIVTATNPFTISSASYSATTGYVTFTMASAPSYVGGSEFTVSGMNSTGASINLTYIAVNPSGLSTSAQQASRTIVGNPLSGPGGTPLAITSPGTITTGGSPLLVSVILPGMTILGSAPSTSVAPYISGGGTGGTGNYNLVSNQTVPIGSVGSPITIYGYAGTYVTAAIGGILTAKSQSTLGDFLTPFGNFNTSNPTGQGWQGLMGNVSILYGSGFIQSNGMPSNTDLVNLCKKQTDIQSYAATKSAKVNSIYSLRDTGIWGDSGNATIQGHITNSPGPNNATLVVDSTYLGSLASLTGAQKAYVTGSGLPVASPVSVTLSTTCSPGTGPLCVGATYALSTTSIAAEGSSGSPLTFSVGQFKPATPAAANNVRGWIDTTGGVSTLHVTSIPSGSQASFTGTLRTSFTVSGIVPNSPISGESTMTVTGIPFGCCALNYAQVGPGMTVTGPSVTDSPLVLYQVTTASNFGPGQGGTYVLSKSETVGSRGQYFGSGVLPGPPTGLQTSSATGASIATGMYVTDGNHILTGLPLLIVGGSGSSWTVAGNYYPAISGDTNMIGTFTTMVPGEYLQHSLITTPTKILSYSGACSQTGAYNGGPGCYTLSAVPNAGGSVGASGSLQSFTGTTITDGGAVAPGPALTIADIGPGTIYPVNHSTNTATVPISGTYDVLTLGGTPTAIQAQVSLTAGGPPVSGCSACAWTNVSSPVVSGGSWSGQILSVPSSPNTSLYVSVRASNGTAYATMREPIRVGDVYSVFGQGQAGGIFNGGSGFNPFFSGLLGLNRQTGAFSLSSEIIGLYGPEILPGFLLGSPLDTQGNRFWADASDRPFTEGSLTFAQVLGNAYSGLPVSNVDVTHDGVGILWLAALGNTAQTQTVTASAPSGILSWCSTSTYCANAGSGGALTFNAAGLTGASIAGTTSTPGGVPTLTLNSWIAGALQPGMVLSPGAGVTGFSGNPTLVSCATNCTNTWSKHGGSLSTWVMSANPCATACSNVALFADVGSPGTSPWKYFDAQQNGLGFGQAGFGANFIRPGTFFLRDDTAGTVLCQDSSVFSYNITGGNCAGTNIDSTHTFVNYFTGDYEVTFTSRHAPATSDVLTAHWTNDVAPSQFSSSLTARPLALDYFGTGGATSGEISSLFSKVPGGVSGQIYSGLGTDKSWITNGASALQGYQYGAPGYSAAISWFYGSKFPNVLPAVSATTKFITTGQWRDAGPSGMLASNASASGSNSLYEQWADDVVTQSNFTGSISGGTLTLSGAATGQMWEGEVIGCMTVSTACSINSQSGVYITGLASGAWGASGSTYSLAGSPASVSSAAPMTNLVYYSGSGPAFYAGALNDINDQNSGLNGTTGANPHPTNGWNGFRRSSARWAATIWGADASNSTPAADPIIDRVKADAGSSACDTGALASPCFDVGTTYSRTYTPTSVSGKVLTFNGLSAHALPIVVGQSVTCSGCSGVLAVSSVSNPPTQSAVAAQGQIGSANNGFTVTLVGSGPLPGGAPAYTFGCSGTPETGSNCIDIAISVRNDGTFGTAAAIDNCGANNLNGTATPNYSTPFGTCSGNGIGEIVRGFRIGPHQNAIAGTVAGNVYDDGLDPTNGAFDQTSAYTCNIVSTVVLQCVKAPAFTAGVPTGVGEWLSGRTFVSEGDVNGATGRMASLMGYVGGQSFPITTAGTGYSNQTIPGVCATTAASGALQPKFDIWTSGGAIVRVVPSASTATPTSPPMGLGIGAAAGATAACTVTPAGGSGAVIPAINIVPSEGVGGIATYATDNNMTGVLLYDNSGEPGNPLNGFFTNGQGGYLEPGLPLRPFGQFQGVGVSG